MKTKEAMLKQGLRYFSSLTPNQKQKTVLSLRMIKNELNSLPFELAFQILKTLPIEKTIEEVSYFSKELKSQKVVYYKENKTYFPLNLKKIIEPFLKVS